MFDNQQIRLTIKLANRQQTYFSYLSAKFQLIKQRIEAILSRESSVSDLYEEILDIATDFDSVCVYISENSKFVNNLIFIIYYGVVPTLNLTLFFILYIDFSQTPQIKPLLMSHLIAITAVLIAFMLLIASVAENVSYLSKLSIKRLI